METAGSDHGEGATSRISTASMFKPATFEPRKKHPIINHICPGHSTAGVGSRSFAVAHGDAQALAELGFIVVILGGMATPQRSKRLSMDRHRARRHPGAFGRWLRGSGCHVPLSRLIREYEDDWGERYQGLPRYPAAGRILITRHQANQNIAKTRHDGHECAAV